MSNSYNYNPRPPRVWSRVQNQCTYTDASNNVYQSVYIPLTKQTVTLAQANYEDKLLQKGNILQYKGNSSQLTKKQKYSQLAKGFGPNRTKVFATQSETYTNPNTTGLLRVNSTTLPFPNDLVGQPNNISGPFQYAVPNPNGCTGLSIQDGGNLVCGTYANPCTGEIIQTGATSSVICNPASASNVPGSATLCWDTKVQTWFPRQRYFMNNSGTKWPQGYKGFVSAVTPEAPVLTLDSETSTTVTVSWANADSICLQISSYRLYVDDQLFTTVPYQINSYTFFKSSCSSSVYVTAVLYNVESEKSNIIVYSGTGIVAAPTLTLASSSTTVTATIQWTETARCITSYNIYIDGVVTSVPSSPLSYSFNVDPSGNDVYIKAVSYGIESPASNTIFVPGIGFTIAGGGTSSYDATLNNYVITFTSDGALIVYPKNFAAGLLVNAVLVGGGGGGAGGGAGGVLINRGAGGGGGGGTIGNYDSFIPQTFPTITLTATIGAGGAGGAADAGGGAVPGAGTQGGTTFANIPTHVFALGGGGGQIGEDSLGFGTGGNGGSSEGAGGIGGAGDGGNAPAGGGGGGAGGASLSSGGNGAENIFATTYPYVPDRGAGGGGGVGNEGSTAGTGGNNYAGNGGSVATGGNGVSGTANYGGGGGGGKAGNVIPGTSGAGGNGGSGIAVFYFQKPA